MKEPGPIIASGRDADIFSYGPGLVLRRSRAGRSLLEEARIMEHVHALGYPVPRVEEVSDDGLSMVMERIDGIDMVAAMTKRPWTIPHHGKVLADLHLRLHALAAPTWLPHAPVGQGDRLLHLDLHPLNVMMSPSGPIVIDWTGASRGDPSVDVALAWVLLTAGEVPAGRLLGAVIAKSRSTFVRHFLRNLEREAAVRTLRDVVSWKVSDPHMSQAEQDRMWKLVAREVGIAPTQDQG